MTDARDELVDVIAEAVETARMNWVGGSDGEFDPFIAKHVLAALVERYGEPGIERLRAGFGTTPPCDEPDCPCSTPDQRRLVFPWQAVKEGDQG